MALDSKRGQPAYWDELAPRYEILYESEWSHYEDELTRELISKAFVGAPGPRVLDLGCGAGLGLELLRRSGLSPQYTGVDVSGGMLSLCSRKFPEAILHRIGIDDVGSMFRSGAFDLIIAINVAASFTAGPEALLRTVHRLLAPGGYGYVSFLNRGALRRVLAGRFGQWERYRTRGDEKNSSFVWAHTLFGFQLRELVERSGLASPSISYQSVLGGVWESRQSVSVERILARLLPWLGHSVAITFCKQ